MNKRTGGKDSESLSNISPRYLFTFLSKQYHLLRVLLPRRIEASPGGGGVHSMHEDGITSNLSMLVKTVRFYTSYLLI